MKKKTAAAKAKPKTAVTKKPALLTATQVKASANKPSGRGTPIGELHYLGREIRGRIDRLDVQGGKTVNMKDSIDRLLADAAKLCDRKGFEAFKECYCQELSTSWTYQLLAVQEGRKTLDELRAATRLRVAKHRAGKRVTESESVTPAPAASDEVEHIEPPAPAIRPNDGQDIVADEDPAASGERRKAEYAVTDTPAASDEVEPPVVGQPVEVEKPSPAAPAQLALPATDTVEGAKEQERKAEIERGEQGLITDAEYKALTADELRDLIGNLFFSNSPIVSFDEFMGMTADALRYELENDGIFDPLSGVMRDEDGKLHLYHDYGDGNPASAETDERATESDPDPLFTYEKSDYPGDNKTYPKATPWLAAQLKPIWDGTIKNDDAKSALALAQLKLGCKHLLPLMTAKDLEEVANLGQVVWDQKTAVEDTEHDAKRTADDAKRIAWEAKHPEKAKAKALKQAQDEAMECDLEDLKKEAKEDGERWSDVKNEKIAEWLADNWEGSEAETEFEKDFAEKWAREHGSNFPHHMDAAERKRLNWEASHPQEAKAKALKQAQDDSEAEQFERDFYEEWYEKHGTLHPDDARARLFFDIENAADKPYEVPEELIDAALNLEADGYIKLDHDSGPGTFARLT